MIDKSKKIIVEDTVGANEINIATTDENLSVADMFQQNLLPSLGKQIFSVLPVTGPTAALFNVRRKLGTNDIELVRAEVEVYPSVSIKTNITQESVQDIKSQYGKEAQSLIGNLLRGLSNDDENTKTLAFLDTKSKAMSNLQLSDSLNAETNLFEITQRVHEAILLINGKNTRSYNAFAVLPYTSMASIFGLTSNSNGVVEGRGLLIAQIGNVKFYLNPDITATDAYVGVTDEENSSKSSAVFSPYTSDIVSVGDPETGEHTYHIFNRYAITASPLHVTDDEMLYKFTILL